jgi:hypothetical protein
MTAPPQGGPPADLPAPDAAPPRGRAVAAVVLALVAIGGILSGVALDRIVLRPHGGPRPPMEMMRFPSRTPSTEERRRLGDELARELGLSAAQRVRVDSVMDQQMGKFQALRQEVRPRMRAIVAETRSALDSVLTPAQRTRLRELRPRFPAPERPRRPEP